VIFSEESCFSRKLPSQSSWGLPLPSLSEQAKM
jgi:hypothetical protein